MIKYSEQWDAYYDETTNEWTESKCDDPTCAYCVGRPEKPLEMNQKLRDLMIEAGFAAPEMAGRARKFADLLIRDCVATVALIGVSNYENEDIVWTVEKAIESIKDRFK